MRIHSEADEEFYLTANIVLNVAKRALEIFKSSEVPEKRQFLNFLLQNCELQGKKLEFSLRNPFNRILATRYRPIGLLYFAKLALIFKISDNVKLLPQELVDSIFSLSAEHFPGIPVYLKSSCALTRMLKIPSITSVQVFARSECEASRCPLAQRRICAQGSTYNMTAERAQGILDDLGIPAHVVSWDINHGLVTHPEMGKFTYAVRQTVFKHLARGEDK